MASKQVLYILVVVLAFIVITLGSNVAIFEDGKCKDSKQNIDGPNGYPNGTCTALDKKGSYKSFQIVDLDDGCTVTLYGNDSDPDSSCSSKTTLEYPRIGTCYNASWIYYSIDFCDTPEQRFSSDALSTSSTSSSTAYNSSTTVTLSQTPIIFPKPPTQSTTGAIAGGVVGGVIGLALVVGLVVFSTRRYQRLQTDAQQHRREIATPRELSSHDTKYEIFSNTKHEILSHEGAMPVQEIGGRSPPAELQGDDIKEAAESGLIKNTKK